MNRNRKLDFLKGFLVVMVILGHTTAAFGSYEKDFILNYCSSLTVSFIMPFFLIITGYFVLNPSKQIDEKWFIKKFRRLCVPAIIWGGIVGAVIVLSRVVYNQAELLDIRVVKQFFQYVRTLWYLYATFLSAIIIGIVNKYFRGFICDAILILIAICLHIIPTDIFWISFAFEFILVGYFVRKYVDNVKYFFKNRLYFKNMIIFIVSFLYLLLLIWFKYDYSVYVSGSNLLTNNTIWYQVFVNTFRFFMGVFGTAFVYIVLCFCYKHLKQFYIGNVIANAVEKIGIISLEMYVTQWVVVEILFSYVMKHFLVDFSTYVVSNPYVCYFFWKHLLGLIMTIFTYIVCKFIKSTSIGKYVY